MLQSVCTLNIVISQLIVDWRSRTRNVSYGHGRYKDGYRYRGRSIGHWADQDSLILSVGGVLQREDGIGWGTNLRSGKLNEDGAGRNTVSDNTSTDYFSFDIFNLRQYSERGLSVTLLLAGNLCTHQVGKR